MPLARDLPSLQAGANDTADANNKLRALILGKNAELQQAKNMAPVEAQAAGLKQTATNNANMATMNELTKNAPDGATVKVGDLMMGQDPYARMMGMNMKGEEAARQSAVREYNKNAPKLVQQLGQIHEGITAVNDPNQVGSAGAAKSLLISGVAGMNRYNQEEGGAIVPSTWFQKAQGLANQLGDGANPLTPQQRQAINSLFLEGHNTLAMRHSLLKQNAMQQYGMSRFKNDDGMSTLQTLGAPVDAQIKQYGDEYSKYTQPQQAPMQPQDRGGIMGGLSDLILGRKSQPAQQQAPAAPAPQAAGPAPASQAPPQPDYKAAAAAEIARRRAAKQPKGK